MLFNGFGKYETDDRVKIYTSLDNILCLKQEYNFYYIKLKGSREQYTAISKEDFDMIREWLQVKEG